MLSVWPAPEPRPSWYAAAKGNLRFPLDQPMPHALITRIVKHRVKKNRAKAGAKKEKKKTR
jgi:uncharacterized protein YdhG (YjbR/CyaY superfamily)